MEVQLLELYHFFIDNIEKVFLQSNDFDTIIYEKYKYLLNNININDIDISNNDIFTSIVILYDQVPRHINRIDSSVNVTTYLKEIYPFVIVNYNKTELLTPIQLSFVLLPLRHTNDFNLIKKVIILLWNKIKISNDIMQYKKFLLATYTRYISKNSDITNLEMYFPSEILEDVNFNKLYLDSKCWKYSIPSIDIITEHTIYKNIYNFIKKNNITYGIVSLSMGVDSAVLSYILKHIGINIIATHINYSNRKECVEEKKIVIDWCKNILNIPVFIRSICEINRKDCMKYEMRELYENYTKNIRFNAYKNSNLYFDKTQCNVFTGHNRDDCFENILTNIAGKSHRNNLTGMLSQNIISDINFIRPMLNCNKKDIYNFAILHKIPFFVDSTPKWSQRGKIRDNIRPALEKWNTNVIDGLFDISNILNLQSLYIIDTVKNHPLIFDYVPTNEIFWTELFNHLKIFVRNKSLVNFLERIKIKKNSSLMLNKNTCVSWKYIDNKIIFNIDY